MSGSGKGSRRAFALAARGLVAAVASLVFGGDSLAAALSQHRQAGGLDIELLVVAPVGVGNGPSAQPVGHNHRLVVILRPESGGDRMGAAQVRATIHGTAHPGLQVVTLNPDGQSVATQFAGNAHLPARDTYHLTIDVMPLGGGPAVSAMFIHRQLQP